MYQLHIWRAGGARQSLSSKRRVGPQGIEMRPWLRALERLDRLFRRQFTFSACMGARWGSLTALRHIIARADKMNKVELITDSRANRRTKWKVDDVMTAPEERGGCLAGVEWPAAWRPYSFVAPPQQFFSYHCYYYC
jgi:hypothetical protein